MSPLGRENAGEKQKYREEAERSVAAIYHNKKVTIPMQAQLVKEKPKFYGNNMENYSKTISMLEIIW